MHLFIALNCCFERAPFSTLKLAQKWTRNFIVVFRQLSSFITKSYYISLICTTSRVATITKITSLMATLLFHFWLWTLYLPQKSLHDSFFPTHNDVINHLNCALSIQVDTYSSLVSILNHYGLNSLLVKLTSLVIFVGDFSTKFEYSNLFTFWEPRQSWFDAMLLEALHFYG